jgi:5'(3')-deoxyribonucleotidase
MAKNIFYLDMDGVCADWDRGVRELGYVTRARAGSTYTVEPQDWVRLCQQYPNLYRNLPLMEGVGLLVDLARQYRDTLGWHLYFLTAIPSKNDVPDAFSDKVAWAQDHFPDISVRFGPYAVDKQQHCRSGDILVDDRGSNCEQWRAKGGLAFQVTGNTLASVLSLIREDLSRRVSLKNLRDLSLDLV